MARCDSCERLGIDHDAVVEACKGSIYECAVTLCQWERVQGSLLHWLVCAWLQWCITTGKKDVLLMMARDFLKTSLLCAVIIWRWINDRETRVLLAHASGEMSSKVIPVLQRIIESDVVKHFFPDLAPGDIWRADAISIQREGNYKEASLEARGVKSSVTGGHYNWILLDDLIDETISRSPLEVQRVVEWNQGSPALFDDWHSSFKLVTGTFWSGGFYEMLIGSGIYEAAIFGAEVDNQFRDFLKRAGKVVRLSPSQQKEFDRLLALPDGAPTWEEQFPKERLDKLRITMGPVNYARQILNHPITDEEQRFKPEWIVYYNWGDDGASAIIGNERIPFKKGVLRATVDPGGDSVGADPSAIVVVDWFPERGIGLVLQAWHGRVQPDRLIDKFFQIHQRWAPFGLNWWGIEKAALQDWLRRFSINEMGRRGIHFTMKPLGTKNKSKAERAINGLQPFIANQQIYFLRNQGDLISEIVNFRTVGDRVVGRSPNLLDCLAMQCDTFRSTVTPETPTVNPDMDEDDMDYYPPPVITSPYNLNEPN